jgi:hypothetical protein
VAASTSAQTLTGIRQVAAPINDMAIASYDQLGPVIYYNADIVRRSDPAVVLFIYAHEYGHHMLGHITRSMFVRNPYYNVLLGQDAEMKADDFATDYWLRHDPRVLERTVAFLSSPAGNMGDSTHLPTAVRAQRIIDRVRNSLGSRGSASESRRGRSPADTDQSTGRTTRRDSASDDAGALEECLERKVQRCIAECEDKYGFSHQQCEDVACARDNKNLSIWRPACERQIRRRNDGD